MAVSQVIEWKRTSGKKLVQQGEALVPAMTRKRFFQIVLDDPATDHADIYDHADIPKLFNPHPEDDGVICKSLDPEQRDDDESYIVDLVAEYDDQYNGSENEDPDPEANHPLNRPVEITGVYNEYDEIVVADIDGTPVRNSALDPFDPPLTRKAGSLRFAMTKNYPALNLTFLRSYKNAVNSDTWNGFLAKEVRVANITFSKGIEVINGIKIVFWRITFEFEIAETGYGKDGTWRSYQLDQGYRIWPIGADEPSDLYGKGGTPVNKPVPLDGSGGVGDPDSPVLLPFDLYRPLPFADLDLL